VEGKKGERRKYTNLPPKKNALKWMSGKKQPTREEKAEEEVPAFNKASE
jgi:hypothetical protein